MDRLSDTFHALAGSPARHILARLSLGEVSVNTLAQPFDMSLPAVSKHLKVLEHAGLISRGRDAQFRPCRLEADTLRIVDSWLEDYRTLWNARFDRLESYLAKLQRQKEKVQKMKVYAERTVTITRILKAPRDLVWRAWTDHAQLKEWWGPEHFTNPVVEGDIAVGGTLHITMHGPKGSPFDVDMPMVKRYREIVPGKKLVFENEPLGPNGERMMDSLTTVTFADHPDGTLMEMTTTAKALNEIAVGWLGGMDQGWGQSFDKLARLLED